MPITISFKIQINMFGVVFFFFRSEHSELRDVIIKSNASGMPLDQQKVDQYIKAMSLNGSEKINSEKLAAMWMYAAQMGNPSMRKLTPPSRPIMLIPASAAGSGLLPPPPTRLPPPPPPGVGPGLLLPVPAPPQYRGMTLPSYMRSGPGSVIYAHPASLTGTYRTHKSTKSAELNGQRRRRRAGKPTSMDANRRQRRKSEADVLDGAAAPNFQYTGLDRAIADSFLARQEQSHAGSSHMDYSSSASSSEATYGAGAGNASRASSKTKIVCRDVVM